MRPSITDLLSPISLAEFASKGRYKRARHLSLLEYEVLETLQPGGWDVLIAQAPPRHGKRLADSTPVWTPDGWRTHGELAVGDFVYAADGTATRIIHVAPRGLCDRMVLFSDGEEIKACGEHLWTVYDRAHKAVRVVSTEKIAATLTMGSLRNGSPRNRYLVDYCKPLVGVYQELPVHPYMLGVWLGDGKSDGWTLCGAKEDMRHIEHRLKAAGYHRSWETVHAQTGVRYVGFKGLPWLAKLGWKNSKRIPEAYLRASVEQRRELLYGLVDTDGSVEAGGRVRFVTVSKNLAEDVALLVATLGYRASVTSQAPAVSTSGIVGRRSVYCVQWTPHDGEQQATVPRKDIRRAGVRRRRSVVSVTRCGAELGQCIQVEHPSATYLVGRSLVLTHNTEFLTKAVPSWYHNVYPDNRSIITSYAVDLARRASRHVRDQVHYTAPWYGHAGVNPNVKAATEWDMAGHLGGMKAAGVGGGITGHGADLFLIDDYLKNAEQAVSADLRDSQWEWFQTTAFTRIEPGGRLIVLACLTGETPVAMADGRELPIESVLPGDSVLTLRDGRLSSAKVTNHACVGHDEVFAIRMRSGRVVTGNARHPFLVVDGGRLRWERLKNLKVGHRIATMRSHVPGVNRLPETSRPLNEPLLSLATCDFTTDEVVSVTPAGVEPVYDIEVAETGNFIANGLVSHNTRWHESDLIGRLLRFLLEDTDLKVREIRLPALAEPTPGNPDPLGRAADEPLWPERLSADYLKKRRDVMDPYWWNALYQQRLGTYGKNEWPAEYFYGIFAQDDEWPEDSDLRLSATALDPSKGRHARKGDYSAIVNAAWHGGTLWLEADIERRPVPQMVRDLVAFNDRRRPTVTGIESTAFQELLAQDYELAQIELGSYRDAPELIDNTVNKELRIARLGTWLRLHRIKIRDNPSGRLLVQQLKDFPNGKHDDGCFAAGSLVQTSRGPVPIEDVRVGDKVATREGWGRVLAAGCTGRREVHEYRLQDGSRLLATPNHPVYDGMAFSPIQSQLKVYQCQEFTGQKSRSLWSTKASRSEGIRMLSSGVIEATILHMRGIEGLVSRRCIRKCGRMRTVLSSRAFKSTTLTVTRTITRSKIWNAYLRRSMTRGIARKGRSEQRLAIVRGRRRRRGTGHLRDVNGIAGTARRLCKNASRGAMCASTAQGNFSLSVSGNHSTARQDAGSDTMRLSMVGVVNARNLGAMPVYNLTVDGGEYFVNGVLVHNCDASEMAVRLLLAVCEDADAVLESGLSPF